MRRVFRCIWVSLGVRRNRALTRENERFPWWSVCGGVTHNPLVAGSSPAGPTKKNLQGSVKVRDLCPTLAPAPLAHFPTRLLGDSGFGTCVSPSFLPSSIVSRAPATTGGAPPYGRSAQPGPGSPGRYPRYRRCRRSRAGHPASPPANHDNSRCCRPRSRRRSHNVVAVMVVVEAALGVGIGLVLTLVARTIWGSELALPRGLSSVGMRTTGTSRKDDQKASHRAFLCIVAFRVAAFVVGEGGRCEQCAPVPTQF
jgi:hypothetical protein